MKSLKIIVLLFFSWFLIHEVIIIVDGLLSTPRESDYAVIFGSKVNEDGTMSSRLEARMKMGLELYQDSLVKKLFVSGGLGKEGHYEAQVMAKYLIENGVPKEAVVIDDFGNNSWLTASNFKQIIPEDQSVIVVTQYFHISRSKLAFRKVGLEDVSGASPRFFEWRDPYSLFREFFGYYKYLLFY